MSADLTDADRAAIFSCLGNAEEIYYAGMRAQRERTASTPTPLPADELTPEDEATLLMRWLINAEFAIKNGATYIKAAPDIVAAIRAQTKGSE